MPCPASRLALTLLAAALFTAPASAQDVAPPVPAAALTQGGGPPPKGPSAEGYLAASRVPDATFLIGPPPEAGSGSEAGDVDTFRKTRALQGSARWALAARDNVYGADALLQDFSCALGVQLTPANAPALRRLFARMGPDAGHVASRAKATFRRPRPFVDHPGAICITVDPSLAHSYSYPSGHSTYSWTAGLILAAAEPDRASEVLARARAYGESRVVCGVHYESDVQAGRLAASALFSALEAEPAFQRDLAAAHAELTAMRAAGAALPAAEQCRIEADASQHPVW